MYTLFVYFSVRQADRPYCDVYSVARYVHIFVYVIVRQADKLSSNESNAYSGRATYTLCATNTIYLAQDCRTVDWMCRESGNKLHPCVRPSTRQFPLKSPNIFIAGGSNASNRDV